MKEISTKELEQIINTNEALNLVDVREDDEVASGKIPQAVHIPLGEIPENLHQFDKGKSYYIICHSGGRSGRACQFLSQQGYDVTNIAGGMLNWSGETE